MKKRLLIATFLYFAYFSNINSMTVCAMARISASHNIATVIETFSAKTEWRYTLINGRPYRRLYDTQNDRWIGDWEPCP